MEADFYQLIDLSEIISDELLMRQKKASNMSKNIYKSVNPSELNWFFDRGWAFVSCFKGDDITACNKFRTKGAASIRDSKCTACGERVDWVRFSDHFVTVAPSVAVISKAENLPGGGSPTMDSDTILFDSSFG